MYKRLIIFAISLLSVLSVLGTDGKVGVKYANRKLKQLSESLPSYRFPDRDTIMEVPEVIKGKSLIFLFNSKKELSHIGVSLFSDETKRLLDENICNFLERYFLELLQQKNTADVKRKLTEYHVTLTMDGQAFGQEGFTSVSSALQTMNMPANFALHHKEKRADAVWLFGFHSLHMQFPLYRELIDGTDKKESDEELYHRLKIAVSHPVSLPDEKVARKDLQLKQGSIYVRSGERFMIKALSSDRYYVEEKGHFVPVFQKQYPEYSMNNLFLTYRHGGDKMLSLTHRKYGHFTPEITIPLLNFLMFFEKEFVTVCHTGYNKQGELETIVVFNHKTLNYLHLLRVSVDKELLFAANPVLKADFYSNIPQHYINSLLK